MEKNEERRTANQLLIEYAIELYNETPILTRYTDLLPKPDGRGGYAEREQDEALRRRLKHPADETTLDLCLYWLPRFRDSSGLWELTRDELLLENRGGEAEVLERRHNRRNADIDKMIQTIKAIHEKRKPSDGLDFREWEEAAERFDSNIAGDVAQIERILEMPPNTIAMQIQAGFAALKEQGAETLAAAHAAAEEATRAADNSEQTRRTVENFTAPRPSDYQVSQAGLSQLLAMKDVATTVRQIQRWEQYLRKNGKSGSKPPDGYTLQTRLTTLGAGLWVEAYAARERGKLTTRNYLDERTAANGKLPARPKKTEEPEAPE